MQSRKPIYEQLKVEIVRLIRLGVYKPHDKLPSIRNLAVELNLNVNTVKRAIQELEADSVIYSVPGKGSYISENSSSGEMLRRKSLNEFYTTLTALKTIGVSEKEIKDIVENIYSSDGE